MSFMCVKVDLERLRLRLSHEQMRDLSAADVHLWLVERGLKPQGDTWVCDGEAVHHVLHDDEIIETISTLTEDGVTYVHSVRHRWPN